MNVYVKDEYFNRVFECSIDVFEVMEHDHDPLSTPPMHIRIMTLYSNHVINRFISHRLWFSLVDRESRTGTYVSIYCCVITC